MALGAGKYDALATTVREATGARAVILLVIDGTEGSGFSVQCPGETLAALPDMLRTIAIQVESDLPALKAALKS